MIAIVPITQRNADQRELEEAERRQPGIVGRLRHEHVHRRAVSASSDPAWAANTSGMSSCDGGRPRRTAMTTTTGSSAATAPLTLISAVSRATSSIVSTSRRVRLCPARGDQMLARPGGHAGRFEARADDEQRRDEDDGGVAEAAERLCRSSTPVA